MSEIKYVIISDFHLGAENSLLTYLAKDSDATDNSKAAPVLVHLMECLREVLQSASPNKKPQLILNGDIMELSMTTENQTGMAFQRFIELAMPEKEEDRLFKSKMVFLAGNHDHNVWETSRFKYFEESIHDLKPGAPIDAPIHVTDMFNPAPIDTHLMSSILKSYPYLDDAEIMSAYPCYALYHEEKDKCIIMHHGHYVESIYSFMSTFDKMIFPDRTLPSWLSDLELENFAWIDFFFSVMGRSGQVGRDVNLAYGNMQSPKKMKEMISNFSKSATAGTKNIILKWLERKGLESVLEMTVGAMASTVRSEDEILVPEAVKGLKRFMEVFVLNQILAERNNILPKDVSFVFGHTHKPFEQDMPFEGFQEDVHVYNGGGWVVESTDVKPFHGGSIILVSEDLDIVSLHMFKEGDYKPSFEVTGYRQHRDLNPLYKHLKKTVDLKTKAFEDFERVTKEQVQLRYRYLSETINSKQA